MWQLDDIDDASKCCGECYTAGQASGKEELVAFHYRAPKSRCYCWTAHPDPLNWPLSAAVAAALDNDDYEAGTCSTAPAVRRRRAVGPQAQLKIANIKIDVAAAGCP